MLGLSGSLLAGCIQLFLVPDRLRKYITILSVEPGETSLSICKLLIDSVGFNAISALSALRDELVRHFSQSSAA